MERDTPRGTQVNPDTLQPEPVPERAELSGDFQEPVDTSSIDVTQDTEDDVYFAPVDPVIEATRVNSRDGFVATFESDSMDSMRVDGSASGRGPGDEALADAIRRELRQDAATTDLTINVSVEDAVAYLHGHVADMDDVANAEDVAGRIPGVREVVDRLEVE